MLLAISKYRPSSAVKYGAFEGLLQLGDRDNVRKWFKQKGSSSLHPLAVGTLLGTGWLDCKDLVLPLLDSKALRMWSSIGNAGGYLHGEVSVREMLTRDLVRAYKTNPGGWDHASRAVAWKLWLRQRK